MNLKGMDWNKVETPRGARQAVPPGFYKVVLMDVGEGTPKAGGPSYVSLEFQVRGGEHDGCKVFDNLLVNAENATARKIAYGRIKSLLESTGSVGIVDDLNELKGRETGMEIRSRDRKDKPGTVSIDVHRYLPLDSDELKATPKSAKVPEANAPAANESAPSSNGKMPWE